MYISKESIKRLTNDFIKDHGALKKIQNESHENVGFLIRKELFNENDKAGVIFNISYNNKYSEKLFLSELKYCAISHAIKKSNNIEKIEKINILNEDKIKDHLKTVTNYFCECDDSINYNKLLNFLTYTILNVKKYYKNKDISLYFI